ncbi:hypothetical protein [Veillonella criceti]|uniref:Lipoprotein n=1 Tax=Veillonella criceti TaxID=103891 RepID=A0A380NKE7_9FIRM|nr:hypothetical protein [Veillonella criceti]SUP42796.1 Uncharacterised protein [Veillonella criceti]
MKTMIKYAVLAIMAVAMVVLAGCGAEPEDKIVGQWIKEEVDLNGVRWIDIKKDKDNQYIISYHSFGYETKQTKNDEQPLGTFHLEFHNTLNEWKGDNKAVFNNNALRDLQSHDKEVYTYNEKQDTLVTEEKSWAKSYTYKRFTDKEELKKKIDELKTVKEDEIKNRTKEATMFEYKYDNFTYDDSVLTTNK